MIEVELKAVVGDETGTRARLEAAGAVLVYTGRMEDRRYDMRDGRFARRDIVLRLRVYRPDGGVAPHAEFDWKGPSATEDGYKVREELSTSAGDPEALEQILERVGLVVVRQVDRDIRQYTVAGASVRFERYPRMDVLLEVEGPPDAIERAIGLTGIARSAFSEERLLDFVARFEERTGLDAALSDRELDDA